MTSADLFARDEESAQVADALRAGQVVENHEITVRRSDGSVFPAAITARPVEYEGEDAAVFGVVDLTEQKKAEAEIVRQREALHQSEKLNALGSLLANVAHELNNPLSVVLGYSTMLRDMAPDEATRQRAIKVHAGAERCARIVKTFLTMARRKPEAWTPVSVNQIVESALDVVGYGLRGADIAVDLDLASDLPAGLRRCRSAEPGPDEPDRECPACAADPRRRPAGWRSPRAARTAGCRSRWPTTARASRPTSPSTSSTRSSRPSRRASARASACRCVWGSSPRTRGEIRAASRPQGGAVFTVTLPATAFEPKPKPVEQAPAPIAGRVLVVDDEVEIAQMVCEVLKRDHHQVVDRVQRP